jgi:hypothetical protein
LRVRQADATHYTEPKKINNFDTTLIGTALQPRRK